MNFKRRVVCFAAVSLLVAGVSLLYAELTVVPQTFDFGWAPDNSHVSARFTIKNVGGNSVALQALKPACGCTAAQFTPMNLSSSADTEIGLTFYTRGYKGLSFTKNADLTTDSADSDLQVHLKGRVADPHAPVLPTGNGIASFEPGGKSSQKITIQNNSDKDMKFSIVQAPASWAKVKLGDDSLKGKQTVDVTISASGSFTEERETSVTISAQSADYDHRVTLAIRTGPPQKEYVPLRPAAPVRQDGPSDPLKLKPVEPVNKK